MAAEGAAGDEAARAAVVGVDVGASTSVCVAETGEIVRNELGLVATRSLLSFAGRERHLGEAAVAHAMSNARNTVVQLPRIVGVNYEQEVKDAPWKAHFVPQLAAAQGDGLVAVGVQYDAPGEGVAEAVACPVEGQDGDGKMFLHSTCLLGMLLGRLRAQCCSTSTGMKADAESTMFSLALPVNSTATQKKAWVDAARIAGWKTPICTYSALDCVLASYMEKQPLRTPHETSRMVALVEMGSSHAMAAVVRLNDPESTHEPSFQVLACESTSAISTTDFDANVFNQLAQECQSKYDVQIQPGTKPGLRLLQACGRLRTLLSTIGSTSVQVENLLDGGDAQFSFTRDDFERVNQDLLHDFTALLQRVLDAAQQQHQADRAAATQMRKERRAAERAAARAEAKAAAKAARKQARKEARAKAKAEAEAEAEAEAAKKAKEEAGDADGNAEAGSAAEAEETQAPSDDDEPEDDEAEDDGVEELEEEEEEPEEPVEPFGLDVVEVFGGGVRVPAVQHVIANAFLAAVPPSLHRTATAEEIAGGTGGGEDQHVSGLPMVLGQKIDDMSVAHGAALLAQAELSSAAGSVPGAAAVAAIEANNTGEAGETKMEAEEEAAAGLSAEQVEAATAAEESMCQLDEEMRQLGFARNAFEEYILQMRSAESNKHGELIDRSTLHPLLDDAENWMYSEEAETAMCADWTERAAALKASVEDACAAYFEAKRADEEAVERALEEAAKKAQEERDESTEDDKMDVKLTKSARMRLVRKNKEEGTELFKDGNFRHAAARYHKALSHAAKFFDMSPEDTEELDQLKLSLYLNLAQCYIKMEQFERVVEQCGHALGIDDASVKALYRRAVAHEKRKDLDAAQADVDAATAIAPDDRAVAKLAERLRVLKRRQQEKERKMWGKAFA